MEGFFFKFEPGGAKRYIGVGGGDPRPILEIHKVIPLDHCSWTVRTRK